ncbi:MAG TPA: hypothetical protein ENH10_06910, partial [Bacteroidetes bacterium]|nr:hypothetical protein [Bacteroidota bacterium]HEX04871.1 hypothetical protein [Bacteroidota bacterium]
MTLHRKLLILIILATMVVSLDPAQAEQLSIAQLSVLPDDTSLTALVLMRERPDIDYLRQLVANLSRDERSGVVWRELDELARRSQQGIRQNLERWVNTGELERIQYLRLVNGIVLHGSPRVYEDIFNHPDISELIHIIPRTIETNAGPIPVTVADGESIPWHIEHIQAPQCWEEGYTGAGVLVAIIDTGINYYHTDISDHLWDGGDQYPNHGYDFAGLDDDPIDESGHGAGVAGLVAGDGTSGINTGVAPDATIMGLRVRQDLFTGVVTDTWLAQD